MVENYEILWDKAIELEKEDPEKAIDYYEQALEFTEHPFIYTNIASCYEKLKEYKKSEYWYKKSESLLLHLDDKYSGAPYANYAWFLYSQKEDYTKALKFSEIAISLEPNSAIFVENHIRILIKLNKKDEFIPYLAKLRLIIPDWDSPQDLFVKYKKGIDKYWKDYWSVSDKFDVLENRLLSHEIEHKLILSFITGKSRKTPDIKHDNWHKLFKDLLDSSIEITDKIFTKLFKILIKREEYDKLLYALNTIIEKTPSGYNLMFSILKTAGMNKSLISLMILKYINDENEYDLDMISKEISATHKRQLKTWYEKSEDFKLTIKIIKLMIRNNYDYFKDEVMRYLSHNLNDKNFSNIITTIPDRDDKLILFAKKHESWLDELKVGKPLKKHLVSYLSSKKIELPTQLYSEFLKFKENIFIDYWDIFANDFFITDDILWNQKIFNLSILFSPYKTLKDKVGFVGEIDNVISTLNAIGIEILFYLKYLSEEVVKNKESEELFVQFTKNNFDLIVKVMEDLKIKEIEHILPIVVAHNKTKSFDLLMKYTASNSKIIRRTVEELLKGYLENYDEICLLLNSRKMDTRILAINLILHFKEDNFMVLLKETLEIEKSKTVQKHLEAKLENLL